MPLTKGEVLAAPWKRKKPQEELGFFGHLAHNFSDPGAMWRYGMTTEEKANKVMNGEIPGAPAIDELDPSSAEKADRYAAGYLLQKEHPTLGPFSQMVGDMFHPGDEIQPYAHLGAGEAKREQMSPEDRAEMERGQPKRSFLHELLSGGYR